MTRAPVPRPQAERVGAPQAGVGEAKPSPEAPARPVQPGPRRALPAGALEPHLAHPQRPPWELERPHPTPPREGALLARGAVRPGAGGGRAGGHHRQPGVAVHPRALGSQLAREGTPASGSGGHPTPPPLPRPAAVSGKGSRRAAGQLLSPSETDESAPAGRVGGGGGGPVTASPRPARPPTRPEPRPALRVPPRAARPEGAGWLGRRRRLSQGR